MKRNMQLILILLLFSGVLQAQKQYNVASPDGRLTAVVTVGEQLTWSLSHDGTALIAPSPVSLTLAGNEQLGPNARVQRAKHQSSDEKIASPFWISSEVRNFYNELKLTFRGNWGITFRLYNDGLAYRFHTDRKGTLTITDEEASFGFTGDHHVWVPYVKGGARWGPATEFFREYLYPYPSLSDQPRAADLPAGIG